MFTVVCALSAAGAVIPSAIAQEEDDDHQDLASGIVSDVLDGSSDDNEDENNDGE
jgi:hypothetical protein